MKHSITQTTLHETLMCGITLLSIPFLSLIIASVTFMIGGSIATWMFPTAVLASLGCGHCYMCKVHCNKAAIIRYYLYTLLALASALLSSAILYDNSYDGSTYHQGAIVGMLHGWNPFYNPAQTGAIWEIHYAKSLEIVASTISICTHRIETGKAVNMLLILSSIFITYHFIRHELPRKNVGKIWLLTLLLTLCPVVVRQAYIYYNDFALYTFMLLAVLSLIQIKRESNNTLAWCILTMSILFATVTKFTIAFYLFLILAIAIIWIFFTTKRRLSYQLTILAIILFIIGFGILGYHPYVTNTLGWGNPFYPLIGSNVDIMTSNTPPLYEHGNRVSNWIRSLFYNAQGTAIWCPFVSDSLHDYYISYDARIAGLGSLFVYAMILSVSIFAWVVYNNKNCETKTPQRNTIAIIGTLLIGGCFIFEQSWWMRYVPFLWAVPIIFMLYTEYHEHLQKPITRLRNIVYIMLSTSVLLCCATTLVGGLSFTQRLGAIFYAVTPQSTVEMYSYGNIISFEHKLNERNIPFRRLEKGEAPSDSTLICVPFPNKAHIYLDPETHSRLPHPDLMDYMLSNK